MDLQALLKKTESRSAKIKGTRAAPSVAMEDRPYTNDLSSTPTLIEPVPTPTPAETKPPLQTDNKAATNREQTGNSIDNKAATNREQTGNNTPGFIPPKVETGNKVATKPATVSTTKWQRTENKLATDTPFSGLVGLQRAILIVIYDACKAARDRVSGALTLEHLAECLQTSSGSVKTTLQRLETKGCILRVAFKNGRGGWSRYELPEAIFRELLQLETENKLETKWQQTGNKLGTQPATEPATSSPVVVVGLNSSDLKTTNTQPVEDKITQPPPRVVPIPVRLKALGLTQQQLDRSPLEYDALCESVDAYAYDLEQGLKPPVGPLRYLLGIIVKRGVPYTSEALIAAESKAIEGYLKRKSEFETRATQQIELEDQINFEKWYNDRSPGEMRAAVPETDIAKIGSRLYRAMLHEWYMNNERMRVAQIIDQSLDARGYLGT
jgi:hypothetical protein